jgi:hypothetical protein
LGKFIDLTGQRFGKLTVIERAMDKLSVSGKPYTMWNCDCDCGNKHIASSKSLRDGTTISCGCKKIEQCRGRFIDMTGLSFGKLKVIKLDRMDNVQGSFWECQCECGNITVVQGSALRRKSSPTNSCRNCANKKDDNTIAISILYNQYKKSAKKRNYEFLLNREDFINLTSKNCNYCGTPPSSLKYIGRKDKYKYNGIDRVNNNFGYIKGNVVTCCRECNRMKRCLSVEEFFNHTMQIQIHQSKSWTDEEFENFINQMKEVRKNKINIDNEKI